MTDERLLLADTCARLFARHLDADVHRAAEAGEWPAALWAAIAEAGLDRVLVPEAAGGVGMGWDAAHVVLHAAGAAGAPVPLAETVAAGWLLARGGLGVPEEPLTLADSGGDSGAETGADTGADDAAPSLDGGPPWTVSGAFPRVPWGGASTVVWATCGPRSGHARATWLACFAPGDAAVTRDANIGRDPRDALTLDRAPAEAAPVPDGLRDALGPDPVRALGALVRACQMAGAAGAVLDIAVGYAGERVQFGRPIARFQAIQQQLAVLAGEAAAADTAARAACRAMARVDGGMAADALSGIAAAKIRAGEAAGRAAAVGHQVLGAIGFTDEHRLHFLTRRLWAWRAEFGGEAEWARTLGRLVAARGADKLWPDIAARG